MDEAGHGDGLLNLFYQEVLMELDHSYRFEGSPNPGSKSAEVANSMFLYMNPQCEDRPNRDHRFAVEVLISHPNGDAEQEILAALREVLQAKHDASDDRLELSDPD